MRISLIAVLALAANTAFAGGREGYHICVDAHLAALDATVPTDRAAAEIVYLHCSVEAIEFAQILSQAQSAGGDRDKADVVYQLELLRDALAATIKHRRAE